MKKIAGSKSAAVCMAFVLVSFFIPSAANAQLETYTHRLGQSTGSYTFWTTPPSERVFQDDAVPSASDSLVRVYAAKNEFEPFQVVVNPASSGSVTVNIGDFGSGIESEIYQVRYVEITQVSDSLGRTGPYPDPLWPIDKGASISVTAGENTAFWFSIYVPESTASGDYSADVTIGGVAIPVELHVFNFAIPAEVHVKSQMNHSDQAILSKYGVPGGSDYWDYVDKIKQYFIDHRLTPKGLLWPGGVTGGGTFANPFIDYDCANTLTDNDGIWGFEELAERYIAGTGLLSGNFTETFNGGTGFPSFMAASFDHNDCSQDQRPNPFCSLSRTSADWYTGDNPSSAYNQQWIQWMTTLRNYLDGLGYLDEAYHYFANEPQDQADYDAVAWYSEMIKSAVPDLKLMVSEGPKPEIYNHPTYTGAKVDIWLPVLNEYDPVESHDREANHGEETWIYFLHGTRAPYFNPITLDHPGIESKLTGWFLWKYRVRGIAYYSMNNWGQNPWTTPLNGNHNGDLFMLYPPAEDNSNIEYRSNGDRFVPSIRFELMRDSFEDYEYLYLLNGGNQPVVDVANPSDTQADKIISNVTSYTRDSEFMYNLRRVIGLKNGNEIATIPDIQPPPVHPRAEGPPGNYYINFQDPAGSPAASPLIVNGNEYMKIGFGDYDETAGYGWYSPPDANWLSRYVSAPNELQSSIIFSDYGRRATFEFDLPNGTYNVTLSVGWQGRVYSHNYVVIEDINFVNDEVSNPYIVRTKLVTVTDNKLSLNMGVPTAFEYTMLNYLDIESAGPTANFSASTQFGGMPLTVRFNDASANGPTAWAWDFDNDGSTDSTLQNPEHTYTEGGTYTVSLTVSSTGGSHTETKTDYITVYGKGDFDCNGTVDVGDCVAILKIAAGIIVDSGTCPNLNCDLDENGRLGLEDGIGILQIAAGLRSL